MNIHLVIASDGEYSDKESWIVQAFIDQAAAFAEAARLNAARSIIEVLLKDYDEKRCALRMEAANKYTPLPEYASVCRHHPNAYPHWNYISVNDRDRIDAEIDSHIGSRPEDPADDYTVVSIPIGERGRWELP